MLGRSAGGRIRKVIVTLVSINSLPEFMNAKVRTLTGALSLFVLVEGLLHGYAGTFNWTNAMGGLFSVPANWSPNAVPGLSDTAVFSNAASYVFTVDVSKTNSSALFNQGSVTLAIPGGIWCVTNQWRVGEVLSNAASVTTISGLLAVTNAAGTAVTSIGRNWTGELAVVGGSLVTDVLQATNGDSSVLDLAHGNLTTLCGVTVSNGTLVVGTDPARPLVWNIVGGNNQILNDGFYGYGGLTLGQDLGVGHAVINLSGSNTILSVPGLDVYSTNAINITGGIDWKDCVDVRHFRRVL